MTKSHGKRRSAWPADASEMNILRPSPNNRHADPKDGEESSDDEVPQDFMIEAAAPASRRPPSSPPARTAKGKERDDRTRPLYQTRRQSGSQPILPTSTADTPVSIPPRPSEINPDPAPPPEPLREPQTRQMRGLDAHERALWNWVNVYNLDAFLQEAYYYYEGKGIYSIALSRGLNLLSVLFLLTYLSTY